jgi:RluA family pseudouridine synthase
LYPVHRLDRDVPGLIVFAKNALSKKKLISIFASHNADRMYIAAVRGIMKTKSGMIETFLAEEEKSYKVRIISEAAPGAKKAKTGYKVTGYGEDCTILEIQLVTGRKNQIRAHMSHIGHPIIGDRLYGAGKSDKAEHIALCAVSLGFTHPCAGNKLNFRIDVPQEIKKLNNSGKRDSKI